MTVLVTGASGLLGAHIVEALRARGTSTIGLARTARPGIDVRGDVTRPGLGLGPEVVDELRATVTHAVLCHGSVDWACSPDEAVAVHDRGTTNVLDLLAGFPRLERLVLVGSLLALGQADGVVGNDQLYVGQRFRNWYEYGKYCAEQRVRDSDLPGFVVRLGPVLGTPVDGGRLDIGSGVLAALPTLVAGLPIHLERRGDFPCFVSHVGAAAATIVATLDVASAPRTFTYVDPRRPTLRTLFEELCRPWRVAPTIVDLPILRRLFDTHRQRTPLPPQLIAYSRPWLHLDDEAYRDLPGPQPAFPEDYIAQTSEHVLRVGGRLVGARP